MKEETLRALADAIVHHQVVRDNRYAEELGHHTCALCRRFDRNWKEKRCQLDDELCPVFASTGKIGCQGSPYFREDYLALEEAQSDTEIDDDAFAAWEQREIDFLISLLPREVVK